MIQADSRPYSGVRRMARQRAEVKMNLEAILERLVSVARQIGAEKVLLSKFDVSSTQIRVQGCDDDFIERVYPAVDGIEVEDPVFYSTDAVAPGWAVFVAGSSVNFKDLSKWEPGQAGV